MAPAIVHLREGGCELKIASDANTFFIDTILQACRHIRTSLSLTSLQHYRLHHHFSDIRTNPAAFEETSPDQDDDLEPAAASHSSSSSSSPLEPPLRVRPYHTAAHGCPLCPPNLCKGEAYFPLKVFYN